MNKGVTAISAWESGQAYPNAIGLMRLSEILNISVDDLLKKNYKENEDSYNKNEYKVINISEPPSQSEKQNEPTDIIGVYERMTARQEKEIERLYFMVKTLNADVTKLVEKTNSLLRR